MPHPATLGCLLLAVVSAGPMAAQEIPVETVPVGHQRCPTVLADPSGGYLVVFASNTYNDHPAVRGGVFAQRLSPSGQRIGPSLTLDASEDVNCVAAEPAGPGRFLAVWGEHDYPGDTIHARHFDFQGNPLSPKVQIGKSSSYVPQDAACDAEGRCWIAWIEQGVASIRARRLDADGQPLGQEIRVDSFPPPGVGYVEHYELALSADPQGGFLAAWWSGDTSTGTPEDPPVPPTGEIHLRRFSSAGVPLGDELLLDPGSKLAYRTVSVCHPATGGFFVAASRVRPDFVSPDEVVLRRFDSAGAPAGPMQIVTSSAGPVGSLHLACGPDGALLLWTAEALVGRRFDLAGQPLGAPFVISNGGGNGSADLAGPDRFLVAWESYLPDRTDIFARFYGPAPSALDLHGGRFQVHATFRDPRTGAVGMAESRALTRDTGLFWFFDSANVELVVKVLDGCGVNGHFWFFAAGLTDMEVEITVTDTTTGSRKQYRNPPSRAFRPLQDTLAFDCP